VRHGGISSPISSTLLIYLIELNIENTLKSVEISLELLSLVIVFLVNWSDEFQFLRVVLNSIRVECVEVVNSDLIHDSVASS